MFQINQGSIQNYETIIGRSHPPIKTNFSQKKWAWYQPNICIHLYEPYINGKNWAERLHSPLRYVKSFALVFNEDIYKHFLRDFELEKNKKNVSKLKNSKWRLNPMWQRKHSFLIKILKMIIFQKIFFCCILLTNNTTFVLQVFFLKIQNSG
jgi:hypothetical protein